MQIKFCFIIKELRLITCNVTVKGHSNNRFKGRCRLTMKTVIPNRIFKSQTTLFDSSSKKLSNGPKINFLGQIIKWPGHFKVWNFGIDKSQTALYRRINSFLKNSVIPTNILSVKGFWKMWRHIEKLWLQIFEMPWPLYYLT